MPSWEPSLVAAITRAVGGENPIENIDHEAKVIEIKRDARVEPSILRGIEREIRNWIQDRAAQFRGFTLSS